MKASVEEGPERTCLELEETVPPLLERDLALWRVWAARWGSLGARAKCVSGPLAKGQLVFWSCFLPRTGFRDIGTVTRERASVPPRKTALGRIVSDNRLVSEALGEFILSPERLRETPS
jgi:hypothetical protein